MAVTKIWPVRDRFDKVLDYAANAKKTDADIEKYHALDGVIDYAADGDKTEKCFYVSGVNCLPENAKEAFAATQKRYGKTTGKVAYHMYQSFAEGEVDADTAHRIGVKLAEEVFGARFEALVATHLNTDHFHNHIVINAISWKDGLKYNDCKESYARIREVSDRLCREYGLSVVEHPQGKGMSYGEWKSEQEGVPTLRSSIRAAIDLAVKCSVTMPQFVNAMVDGRYEMISGHRRKRACERLGLPSMRCEVVDVSRDEAIILMVDSNSQRSEIAPCDKGRAYKMKMDALCRQGQRTDLTSRPVVDKSEKRTGEIIGEASGESERTVQRYIRLTQLIPELQDFVDEGRIKMRPAVELSYLDEEAQRDVVDLIDETEAFPSHDQAIRMRKAFEDGKLDHNGVDRIMKEEKPNQKPSYKLKYEDIKAYFKPDASPEKVLADILKGLELLKKQRARENREAR